MLEVSLVLLYKVTTERCSDLPEGGLEHILSLLHYHLFLTPKMKKSWVIENGNAMEPSGNSMVKSSVRKLEHLPLELLPLELLQEIGRWLLLKDCGRVRQVNRWLAKAFARPLNTNPERFRPVIVVWVGDGSSSGSASGVLDQRSGELVEIGKRRVVARDYVFSVVKV